MNRDVGTTLGCIVLAARDEATRSWFGLAADATGVLRDAAHHPGVDPPGQTVPAGEERQADVDNDLG
ncbi:MAG: hypothetical protein HOO96_42795 [Polyangiaceae bacterium]|nr:hypothetical protein [Polyangiaceae bacterium]